MKKVSPKIDSHTIRQAALTVFALFAVINFGTIGYMLIEDYTFTQAVFMTIITVATVGFGYIKELSPEGMWFSVFLIVTSIGIFAYAISSITQFIVNGVFSERIKTRNMIRKINKQKDHVIVIGYGRNGSQSVKDLTNENITTIIIDNDPEIIEKIALQNPEQLYIYGDATSDEVLKLAGISEARALIAALPDDASNLFVVITAHELNPGLKIISRASKINSVKKLKIAGASNVVMPDKIGGQHMAKLIAEPDIVEFMEYIMLKSNDEVHLEEISCNKLANCFNNKSISELGIRNMSGANIIGMKNSDGHYLFNPQPETKLTSGDQLFALGSPLQIESLIRIIERGE